MKFSWDKLLDRIGAKPLEHLGGYSPTLLYPYFSGYSMALAVHGRPQIEGAYGLYEFNKWFIKNAYAGPQGWPSYCCLLTNTEDQALELFFEFRRIAKAGDWKDDGTWPTFAPDGSLSVLELIESDAIRKRPAMYFGNNGWLPKLWSMWSGYVWAERDVDVKASRDSEVFAGFTEWLRSRFGFAQKRTLESFSSF